MARLRPEWKNMKNEYKHDLFRKSRDQVPGQGKELGEKGQNRSGGIAKAPERILIFEAADSLGQLDTLARLLGPNSAFLSPGRGLTAKELFFP